MSSPSVKNHRIDCFWCLWIFVAVSIVGTQGCSHWAPAKVEKMVLKKESDGTVLISGERENFAMGAGVVYDSGFVILDDKLCWESELGSSVVVKGRLAERRGPQPVGNSFEQKIQFPVLEQWMVVEEN